MSDNTTRFVQNAIVRLNELASGAQELIDELGNMAGVADCDSDRDALESRLCHNLQSQFTTLCAAFDHLKQPNVLKVLQEGFARFGSNLTQWDYESYTGSFLSPVLNFIGQFIPLLKLQTDDAISGFEEARFAILENLLNGTARILEDAKIVPTCETDINRLMKPIIKAAFPDSIPCPQIPTVVKTYEPEIGVPSLGALVEFKYATSQLEMKQCLDGIFADSCGYTGDTKWKAFYAVFFQTGAYYSQAEIDAQFKQCGIHESWKSFVVTGKGTKKPAKQQPVVPAVVPVAPAMPPAVP